MMRSKLAETDTGAFHSNWLFIGRFASNQPRHCLNQPPRILHPRAGRHSLASSQSSLPECPFPKDSGDGAPDLLILTRSGLRSYAIVAPLRGSTRTFISIFVKASNWRIYDVALSALCPSHTKAKPHPQCILKVKVTGCVKALIASMCTLLWAVLTDFAFYSPITVTMPHKKGSVPAENDGRRHPALNTKLRQPTFIS